MKKYLLTSLAGLLLCACQDTVRKPDRLVDENKMVDILYDLYVIEGIRQSNPSSFLERHLEPSEYVLRRYGVDSLQFVQSDHWYAADTDRYKNLYKKVLDKVQDAKKKNGPVNTSTPTPSTSTTAMPPAAEFERLRLLKRKARQLNREANSAQPKQ